MTDLLLFRFALRDLLRFRKFIAAVALMLLPAVMAVVWRVAADSADFDPEIMYNTIAGTLVFGFSLVILAVVFGTGALSQELEQKTIVYLLTRPLPRWRLLLIRFAAAFVVVTITMWLSIIVLALVSFGLDGLSDSRFHRDMLILPVGVFAYGSLFLWLATVLNRPLIYGLLFAFGWETWVPMMPGSFSKASLMAYLRVLAPHPEPESSSGFDIQELLQTLSPDDISEALAWKVLVLVSLLALGAALMVFSKGQYVPRDDEA